MWISWRRACLALALLAAAPAQAAPVEQVTGLGFVNTFLQEEFDLIAQVEVSLLSGFRGGIAFADDLRLPLTPAGREDALNAAATDLGVDLIGRDLSLTDLLLGEAITNAVETEVVVSPGTVFLGSLDDIANVDVVSGVITVTTIFTETNTRLYELQVTEVPLPASAALLAPALAALVALRRRKRAREEQPR